MNKKGIDGFYRMVTVISFGFVIWKIVQIWHRGLAEKAGHAVDISLIAAAKQLEKTALALERWAENSRGETLGKSLDEVLVETKKTLENATGNVQQALNRKK